MSKVACLAVLVCFVSCSRSTELIGDGSIPGLLRIDVSPGASQVTIKDLTAPLRVELVATGHFESGVTRNITDEIEWGVDNRDPGAFVSPGQWQSSNLAGGLVTAVAEAGPVRGIVVIEVYFEPTIRDSSFPPPPGSADLFDVGLPILTGDPERAQVVYPASDTLFPINLRRTLFQFELAEELDTILVRFVSDYLDLKVLTTNDRWQAEGQTWNFLALTAAGRTSTITVSGLNSQDPTTVWQSADVSIGFSATSVDGAIYYWSTSAEGIMKTTLSDRAPSRFYSQSESPTCVGCHTLSRDGERMALGYDGEVLQQISVPERDVVVDTDRGYEMGWSTFSPDSRFLLLANKGELRLIDAVTGDPVSGDGRVYVGPNKVSHPDWSPRGDAVAVSVCDNAGNNRDVDKCSIGILPVENNVFGALQILVPAAGGSDNNYFPRFSPDGEWLVYVNAPGKSRDQPGAGLRLVSVNGGAPIDLALASKRVGPLDGVIDTGSTMPSWAPATSARAHWLAFSSRRDYGVVLTGDKADQIWIAGLDMDRASAGLDPSSSAFWLPSQDPSERNHRAFWAIDSAVDCTAAGEVCDGFDNDCNGVIDDGCVPCMDVETCFDDTDNDCNGNVDEGCVQ